MSDVVGRYGRENGGDLSDVVGRCGGDDGGGQGDIRGDSGCEIRYYGRDGDGNAGGRESGCKGRRGRDELIDVRGNR